MWPILAAPLSGPWRDAGEPSVHAEHERLFAPGARPASLPPRGTRLPMPVAGPDMRVYGYLAYWDDDLASVPWNDITDLAVFSAGVTTSGDLTTTYNWDIADDAVAMAAPYGVRVHLCITLFDGPSIDTLLSSSTARNHLIDELVEWEADTGAHGINVDFEGLPASVKPEMVQFVTDLDAAVGDVVLATPAVDWAGSWDYDQLTQHADLFIMGYGYHWNGSSYSGPSDPLDAGSGTIWSGINSYSLSWTVDDYLTWGAVPERVILGLPLYGQRYPTANNNVPTATTGNGSSITFENAWALGAGSLESDSQSLYLRDGNDQIWFGDEGTVRERIQYVRDETSLAGIGFWALHYDGDDASFWDMVHAEARSGADDLPEPPDTGTPPDDTGTPPTDHTGDPVPPDPTGFRAEPGAPFLAYVGDTVRLSAEGSSGPAGVALAFEWTQIAGPTVTLDDPTGEAPSFAVEQPGTVEFELRVGDGDTWSTPASSWVVVVDPNLPRRHVSGCGCDAAPSVSGAWWVAVALLSLRRYRARPS